MGSELSLPLSGTSSSPVATKAVLPGIVSGASLAVGCLDTKSAVWHKRVGLLSDL